MTKQQRTYAEVVTGPQLASPVWHEQRVGRITASTAHAALRARDPLTKSLITGICKPSTTPINTPASPFVMVTLRRRVRETITGEAFITYLHLF